MLLHMQSQKFNSTASNAQDGVICTLQLAGLVYFQSTSLTQAALCAGTFCGVASLWLILVLQPLSAAIASNFRRSAIVKRQLWQASQSAAPQSCPEKWSEAVQKCGVLTQPTL